MTKEYKEKDIYFQYLKDISKYPLLTVAEEKILLKEVAKGNKAALNKLVRSNLKFVVNIANLYKGQGLDVNELINEGNMGLIEAAQRFNPDQKIKFISYAVWWVRQNITRAIAEKARLVRISAEKELVLRRFNRHGGVLRQTIGGNVSIDPESLEGLTRYKAKDIEKILMMANKATSLDTPVGEDGDSTLQDCIASEGAPTDALAKFNNKKDVFKKVLNENLNEQEQKVIGLYYGLEEDLDLNLKEIAPVVGLSKERVRQLKETALAKLRNSEAEKLLTEVA
ncbi:MAG: RNA polymerase sigma factor RpoD/SigA [Fibrobacteraceae bacterium]|jgi:RNA polymerase primary sigma factor|nr:RNA polymerase sigma factor RpoD/SigA [Fibrobacteraceae bacterium]MBQ5610265.1 RNA polymerase sigma factor RpoD/SigA [Fibrobacteraceae bacterium]MEE1276300.1 RNA polymerase sigma factor RpoD/SigA [Fibrobacteraceae bacterium]